MNYLIHTDLNGGSLLNGKCDWPISCQLSLQGGSCLIKIDLVDDGEFDVFELLNTTFGCNLPKKFLIVSKAGFFALYATDKEVYGKSINSLFPRCSLPKSIANKILLNDKDTDENKNKVKIKNKATYFWITISLQSIELFSHMIEIGYGDDPSLKELSMFAYLTTTQLEKTEFNSLTLMGDLPNIKLLNTFLFSNLHLEFNMEQIEKSKYFLLFGNIQINLFGNKYEFQGKITVDNMGFKTNFNSITKPIPDLFNKGMPGISFSDGIQFIIEHTFGNKPNTLCYVSGSVHYAGLELGGLIYIKNSKPVLATVLLNDKDTLSISNIFNLSIKGLWPSNFIDIVFLKESQIYYSDSEIPVQFNNIIYQPKFNIYAKLELTIIKKFYITGNMQIKDNGVIASFNFLQDIDLYVIQITGIYNEPGPKLSFSTVDGSYMILECGLSFFNEKYTNLSIACGKNEAKELELYGKIDLVKKLLEIFNVEENIKIEFRYSKSKGLSIEGWPNFDVFDVIDDKINFIKKMLSELDKGTTCGKISELLIENTIKSKYSVKPSFTNTNNQLYFVLDLKAILSFIDKTVMELDFDHLLHIKLDSSLNLNTLMKLIIEKIGEALESLVKSVIYNPDKLCKLMVILLGKQAAKYAAELVCRKLINSAAASAIEAGASAFLGALAAGVAVDVAISTGFSTYEKKMEPSKPQNLKASFTNSSITFYWDTTESTDRYNTRLFNDKEELLGEKVIYYIVNVPVFQVTYDIPKNLKIGFYKFTVTSVNDKVKCEENTYICYKLATPEKLDLKQIANNKYKLQWQSVENAVGYNVNIKCKGDTAEIVQKSTINEFSIDLDSNLYKYIGDYYLGIQALHTLSNLNSEISKIITIQFTVYELAEKAYKKNYDGIQCAKMISLNIPEVNCINMTTAMKQGGYSKDETFKGIRQVYKTLDFESVLILSSLMKVYGVSFSISIEQLVAEALKEGKSGLECGKIILEEYPQAGSIRIAIAMKKAGYPQLETYNGLKVARPDLTEVEIRDVLHNV